MFDIFLLVMVVFIVILVICAAVSIFRSKKRQSDFPESDYHTQLSPGLYSPGVTSPGWQVGALPLRTVSRTPNRIETVETAHSRGSDISTGILMGVVADELLHSAIDHNNDNSSSGDNSFSGFGGGESGGGGASGSWDSSSSDSSSSSSYDSGSSYSSDYSSSSSFDSGSSCDSGSSF